MAWCLCLVEGVTVILRRIERTDRERIYRICLVIDGRERSFHALVTGDRIATVRVEERFWDELSSALAIAGAALEQVLRFHKCPLS